jgi:8-oxo-dGTP diphosphatase
LEECAVREAKEETGVEVENVRFRAVTNDVFEEERKHYLTVWMEAEYVSGEPTVRAGYEMSEVEWFPWSRLPTPLFLAFENLVSGRSYGELCEGDEGVERMMETR